MKCLIDLLIQLARIEAVSELALVIKQMFILQQSQIINA
jgi:hypothetical protein